MSDINFEKDQEEVLDRTENLTSLANQVKTLRTLEDQVKADEELLKNKKTELERILKDRKKRLLASQAVKIGLLEKRGL